MFSGEHLNSAALNLLFVVGLIYTWKWVNFTSYQIPLEQLRYLYVTRPLPALAWVWGLATPD